MVPIQTKAGFVSLIGRPNVGKSTLLNRLVGQKLAAVSPKPQTTRHIVRGILNEPRGQIVFLDTPGLHAPRDPLGERMVSAAKSGFEADLILWLTFPHPPSSEEARILDDLKASRKPVILAVNKVDQTAKPELLPVLDAYHKFFSFAALFPISASKGDNVPELLDHIFGMLPENPAYFPADIVSDQTERFIVSEMIREQVFRLTGEEVPYASAVEVNEFKEKSESLVTISATIHVDKASQKKIVIGRRGEMIKKIGSASRGFIESFLGKKVYLALWVKEHKAWRKDEPFLHELEREGGAG